MATLPRSYRMHTHSLTSILGTNEDVKSVCYLSVCFCQKQLQSFCSAIKHYAIQHHYITHTCAHIHKHTYRNTMLSHCMLVHNYAKLYRYVYAHKQTLGPSVIRRSFFHPLLFLVIFIVLIHAHIHMCLLYTHLHTHSLACVLKGEDGHKVCSI